MREINLRRSLKHTNTQIYYVSAMYALLRMCYSFWSKRVLQWNRIHCQNANSAVSAWSRGSSQILNHVNNREGHHTGKYNS